MKLAIAIIQLLATIGSGTWSSWLSPSYPYPSIGEGASGIHETIVPVSQDSAVVFSMPAVVVTGTASIPSQMAFGGLAALTIARDRHGATLLNDGRVLFAGGWTTTGGGSPLNSLEIYDPATHLVAIQHSQIPWGVAAGQVILLSDGRVLLLGAYDSSLYDATTDHIQPTSHFVVSRSSYAAVGLEDGSILVTGGMSPSYSALSSVELFEPATGMFTLTGSLRTPRGEHTATLLENGKVLIVGGFRPGIGYLKSAELYDPTTKSFTTTGSLTYARSGHTATRLQDGRVLIVGGCCDGSTTAEIYDPASGTFRSTGTTLSTTRIDHSAILMDDGRVLICCGGGDSSEGSFLAELYDPDEDRFVLTSSMSDWRTGASATRTMDGTVLVAGGVGTTTVSARTIEVFDPIDDTFISFTTLVGRNSHTSTNLPDGNVLIAGGYANQNRTYLSSAQTYSSTAYSLLPTGDMLAGRAQHTASPLADGRVLIAGGATAIGITSTAELYDPKSRTFTNTDGLRHARVNHAASTLADGSVLVCGGNPPAPVGTPRFLASCERYNPATGNFTDTGGMRTARSHHTMTPLVDGRVLIVGGLGDASGTWMFLAQAELYDPIQGVFTTTGILNTPRVGHTATLLPDGRVMVLGGNSYGGFLATVEIYDPETGDFTLLEPLLSITRFQHSAIPLSDGTLLLIGGNYNDQLPSAEIIDTATLRTILTTTLQVNRYNQTGSVLPNGDILVVGGANAQLNESSLANTELGQFRPSNIFTGVLEAPAAWVNHESFVVTVTGYPSNAPVASASLSLDGVAWGNWFSIDDGISVTETVRLLGDGQNQPIYLGLRDVHKQVSTVVSVTVGRDMIAPAGGFTINDGDHFTHYTSVTLNSAITDEASGLAQMQFSNDGVAWSAWQPYAPSAAWTLFTGDGQKTVYARYEDRAGNNSAIVSATIHLDQTPPTGSVVLSPTVMWAAKFPREVKLQLTAVDVKFHTNPATGFHG